MLFITRFIRSILVLFSFAIFGIGAIILNFLIFPIAQIILKDNRLLYFYSDIIRQAWKWFVGILISLKIIKLNISGLEEIKQIRQKVIVATHPSFIDILILIALIPRTSCIVKYSLSRNPILFNLVNSIFIMEDESLDKLKFHTKQMIEKGFNIVIFPMGIRHRRNEFPKIKKGAATIAINAKCNIVALKYYTDSDFLFIHQPIYEAGDKTVNYDLSYAGEIDVISMLQTTDNEIVIKKNITKKIESILYQ